MNERFAATEHEIEWVLKLFAVNDEEFDKTVCIMAIPAEDDAVHDIGDEDKHATLLFFGDRGEHFPGGDVAKELLIEAITEVAESRAPFAARVTGVEPLGHDDEPAQVWLLDSPDLHEIFNEIPAVRAEVQDMYDVATDNGVTRYPEYKPHVTIFYGPGDDVPVEAQTVEEIFFDRLSLWWGNEHIDIPLGIGEFDALLQHFGGLDLDFGFDPNQPRAEDGRWDPAGGKGSDKKDDEKKPPPPKKPEPPKMTKAQRAKALVEGVLDALDAVLNELTSKQARALIKQIKANATAFIDGQAASGGNKGGGNKGGGGGGKKDGATKDGKDSKDSKDTKDSGGRSGEDGGGGTPKDFGTVEGIVNSVESLIKGYGQNMKKADKAKLTKALDNLKKEF